MDSYLKFCITTLVLGAGAIFCARGDAIVTGTVFCDQCKDGQISLFDFPIFGIKVSMACPGNDGQPTMWGEETTNWVGSYGMRFEGSPDLSSCSVQVLSNGQGQGPNDCAAAAGPPMSLKLIFSMFGMEMYTVDPLLSQPAQPISFCSNSPVPTNPVDPSPAIISPILPQLPSPQILEASACPHQKWRMPEYRCYWKAVTPDTKVAVAFGLIVAKKYGTDLSLWKALEGRGEVYRTLLREGTTALLNSYNSLLFTFHPVGVIETMNLALLGTPKQALHIALKFMKANSGNAYGTCKLTPCKSEN